MKPRNPFRGAPKGDIRILRAYARYFAAWESRLNTPSQYLAEYQSGILDERDQGLWAMRVRDEFEFRAWKRAMRTMPGDDYDRARETNLILYERRWDRKAAQVRELRGLRSEVAALGRRVSALEQARQDAGTND